MVVCYRASRITEVIVRLLVRVPWCSLPNLIAGRAVVPEFLQDAATGEALAAEALRILRDPLAAELSAPPSRRCAPESASPVSGSAPPPRC